MAKRPMNFFILILKKGKEFSLTSSKYINNPRWHNAAGVINISGGELGVEQMIIGDRLGLIYIYIIYLAINQT